MRHGSAAHHSRSASTIARILATVSLTSVFVLSGAAGALASPAHRETPLTATSVSVTVERTSSSTPLPSDTPKPLDITLQLVNTTDQALKDVTIKGVRATPLETQSALDDAIAKPQQPDPTLSVDLATRDQKPVTTDLGPRATSTVVFRTSTELPNDATSLCLCRTAIYPLYFAAHVLDPGGNDVQVGSTQTYLPSFPTPGDVQPTQVSWIWPILDRPHRLLDGSVFLDDDLAADVSVGRLSRVLEVLTDVAGKVPITVLLDPELIDELAVMADGKYTVETSAGRTQPGVGAAAAKAWLTQLRTALAQSHVQVSFTAYADPDVEALTRNGLSWTAGLGQDAQTRIAAALGGPLPTNDLGWPVGESADQATIDALARQGTSTIVLSDRTLPPANRNGVDNELTTLQSAAGPVTALTTAASVQRQVSSVVSLGGAGFANLPLLVAEVAIRAVETQQTGTYLPIVPPRLVNPSPDAAAAAILATTRASWSSGIDVTTAARTITPSDHAGLIPPDPNAPGLSPSTVAVAQRVSLAVPALTTMLSANDADTLLGGFPAAVQRTESSAWRSDPSAGDALARRLAARIDALESGVRIVKPANGRYTLASSNSPLPITIENRLSVPVTVRIEVGSVNGLPGFSSRDTGRHAIAPNSKVTLHVPTQVERTGRFQVQAVLLTPSGAQIGSVELSVRSTALGTIGVIITAAAGGVLVLALLVRAARRFHRRKAPDVPPAPRVAEPV